MTSWVRTEKRSRERERRESDVVKTLEGILVGFYWREFGGVV